MSPSRNRKVNTQSPDVCRCLLLPLLLNCLILSTQAAPTERSLISHHTPGFSGANGVTSVIGHHEGPLAKVNEAMQTTAALGYSGNVNDAQDAGEAQTELWEGIRKDDPEQIVRAHLKGADLNARRDLDQLTPLVVAARDDRLEAVKTLVRLGAGLEFTDGQWNATPLHYASYCGHLRVVIELVASGANARAKDGDGHTPHHYAERWDHNDVKSYLQAVLFRDYNA